MKQKFNHRGVKLFFITFTVKGRDKMLSKLVDEKSRPELSPLGETVKALWRNIYKVYPWLGTSDHIIMPDRFDYHIPHAILKPQDERLQEER